MTNRRAILATACLSMMAFGVVLTTLGATLPALIARFAIDKQQAGSLISLMSFGVLGGALVFGPIVDRRGYKAMLCAAFATIIAGLVVIAYTASLPVLRVAILLTGFTGGLVNGAANALVADVIPQQRGAAMTFVGGFFGVGAAGLPLILAALSATTSQRVLLSAIAGVVAVPLLATALARFPTPKQPHAFPADDARRLLRDPILLLMGTILFLESGMESIVGGWAVAYFAEEMHALVARAPVYLALFWAGLMLTRWTLGAVLGSASGVRVLGASVTIVFASSATLVMANSLPLAAAAVFVLGCGFAPAFPIVLGLAAERYQQLSGTALSMVFTMALTGGMILPYVTGVIGSLYGLRPAFALIPGSAVVMGLLLLTLARQNRVAVVTH